MMRKSVSYDRLASETLMLTPCQVLLLREGCKGSKSPVMSANVEP